MELREVKEAIVERDKRKDELIKESERESTSD
jgi:hypothetical protein